MLEAAAAIKESRAFYYMGTRRPQIANLNWPYISHNIFYYFNKKIDLNESEKTTINNKVPPSILYEYENLSPDYRCVNIMIKKFEGIGNNSYAVDHLIILCW